MLVNVSRNGKRPDGARRRRPGPGDGAGTGTQYMLVAMAVVEIAGFVYFAFTP